MGALVRVSFPRAAAAPRAICPLPRAITGAAAISLAIPAAVRKALVDRLRAASREHAPSRLTTMAPKARGLTEPTDVETLVYELLDAHADTVCLAEGLEHDPAWSAHIDYLRALQREGLALLSQLDLEDAA
jgi:hypothetical protein